MTTLSTSPGYFLSRRTDTDDYTVWKFDPAAPAIVSPVPNTGGTFDRRRSVVWIGSYFLTWGPEQTVLAPAGVAGGTPYYDYRLVPYDASARDPLNGPALQAGQWPKTKFWGRFADFGNPTGGHKAYDTAKTLDLIPLGTFLLNFIGNPGRGTFGVWSFDPSPDQPCTADPIPSAYPYTAQGAFRDIQAGHELIPLNGYVLDRETATGKYRLWSFDPQAIIPLAHPAVQRGTWEDIDASHQLVPIGDHVLDWVPATRAFRLWAFDPKSANPLTGPVRSGTLPDAFAPTTTLTGFQPPIPIDAARARQPGTIDYMRTKVKHVVYYMLENRSFDHVVGWLHDKDANVRVIGPAGPYKGASTDMYNVDEAGEKVYLSKYKGGKLSNDWSLEMFTADPYHDLSDTLRQMYFANPNGYDEGATPDMGGFVVNNSSPTVMETYTPRQVPVLNGLAKAFAISDEWFSSMPAATDVNRAFAVTGSAQQQLNNFMSPPQYLYWPEQPHRASIWKTLWANGITNWTIYNSTLWTNHVFTYELFLMGQIVNVDASVTQGLNQYVAPITQFYQQAAQGTLPAFSYLEPVWIGLAGTSSYHPGEDLIPGEVELNNVYNALRNGPNWDDTLLIVTFDEHGGIFDHVPPPRAENPWPNDVVDGFRYDVMGVRVPTIVASPLVEENTVFRSTTDVAYDGTSFLATLLQWYGIPRERWFLGERVNHAPSFEGVVTRATPRADSPAFTPPYDSAYPRKGEPKPTTAVHDLHLHVAHVLVGAMARGKLSAGETAELSHQVASQAHDVHALTRQLDAVAARLK
jgi:phospholipase C